MDQQIKGGNAHKYSQSIALQPLQIGDNITQWIYIKGFAVPRWRHIFTSSESYIKVQCDDSAKELKLIEICTQMHASDCPMLGPLKIYFNRFCGAFLDRMDRSELKRKIYVAPWFSPRNYAYFLLSKSVYTSCYHHSSLHEMWMGGEGGGGGKPGLSGGAIFRRFHGMPWLQTGV